MSRIFPPVTMNPPGYLGDDDSLGGPSQRRSVRSRRGVGRRAFAGPGLNSSGRTPYPMYLPTHAPDWDGLGETLGAVPVAAAVSVAGAAGKALKQVFGHPKDAGRLEGNRKALAAAQAGNRNAYLYLLARGGQNAQVLPPIPELGFTGGRVEGWATAKTRADAKAKAKSVAARFAVKPTAPSGGGGPSVVPPPPSPGAEASIFNTPELSPGSLPNTNTVAGRVANAAQAISAFAQSVQDSTGGAPAQSGGGDAGGAPTPAPASASILGLSPAMLAAAAIGGYFLLRGRKRGRR